MDTKPPQAREQQFLRLFQKDVLSRKKEPKTFYSAAFALGGSAIRVCK
jgi:hypothetical protein